MKTKTILLFLALTIVAGVFNACKKNRTKQIRLQQALKTMKSPKKSESLKIRVLLVLKVAKKLILKKHYGILPLPRITLTAILLPKTRKHGLMSFLSTFL
jgi:uncharacterized secreted protein with C-terminal beta-propeller domain